jgi:diguanylate cyclase (GGDEF)-like protein/PAS domain S-box-containing protein
VRNIEPESASGVLDGVLLASLPDGVVAYAADGRCLFANEAAARLLGVSQCDLLACDYVRLDLWKTRGVSDRVWETVAVGQTTSWEGTFNAPASGERWLRVRQSWMQTEAGLVLLISMSDLTERKEFEKTLSLSQASMDRWPDPVYWLSPSGNILFVNDAGCVRYGYTRDELLGLTVRDITLGLTEEGWAVRWQEIKSRRALKVEVVHQTKHGEIFPVEVAANYFVHDGKEYNVAFVRDATERRKQEETLHLTKLSVDKAADLIHWVDSEGRLLYVSDSVCARHGYTREELMRMTIFDLDPLQNPDSWQEHWRAIKVHGTAAMESVHRTRGGELFPVEVTANFVESGGTEYNFAFARDVSERRGQERELVEAKEALERANEKLEQQVMKTQELNRFLRDAQEILVYQATTDALTGAMNRWAVLSRLHEEETRAAREGTYLGIGVIDLDRFKKINDRYGHVAGDAVLNAVAARLSMSIRPYDLLGRFGGEEFLVILPRADATEVRTVLERIRRAVCDSPIEADGRPVAVTLSAGGACARGTPADELIRAADQALYRAKRSGRNRVAMAEGIASRLRAV